MTYQEIKLYCLRDAMDILGCTGSSHTYVGAITKEDLKKLGTEDILGEADKIYKWLKAE